MFSPFLKAALLMVLSSPAFAEISWLTDMSDALESASKEKKPILAQFTGSDWCEECIQLKKSVLTTEAFENSTKDKYVFVEIDFPHKKEQSDEQKLNNKMWKSRLGIIGLPTIIILDEHGKPYASIVGNFSNPDDFLTVMTALQRNRVVRDKALEQVENATGKQKIAFLVQALKAVPEETRHTFYANEMKTLEELDKSDSTGFIKQQKYRQLLYRQEAEIENRLRGFRNEFLSGNSKELIDEITNLLKDEKWLPETRQKLLLGLLFTGKDSDSREKTISQLNTIIEIAPRSQEATIARNIKRNLEEDKKTSLPIDRTKKSETTIHVRIGK